MTEDCDTPASRKCGVKKARTIYKAQQVCVLEQVFAATHYPVADYVERLASDLNISEGKIKVGTTFENIIGFDSTVV